MRRCLLTLVSGVVVATWTVSASAAPVDADPNKPYLVTPDVGPWVIFAASYKGANCKDFAHQAVLCLRQRDQVPAYVYDRGEAERRQQREFMEEMRRDNHLSPDAHLRTVHIDEECAVLIGGFKDMESAGKALAAVKKLPPPNIQNYKPDMMVLPGSQGPTAQLYAVNPFTNSFVTRNPVIPFNTEKQKKEYEVLKHLNEEEDYSLLKCKAPWTLEVQAYSGPSIIQTSGSTPNKFTNNIGLGQKSADVLAAAANQAHEVARLLRTQHYDAYVLHTRRASYVAVGGFSGPEDPQLKQMQARFAQLAQHNQFLSPSPQPMRVPQPQ